jgi:hypothetical protein
VAIFGVLAIALAGCATGHEAPATGIGLHGATLNGYVSSTEDGNVEYWFNYGTSDGYGKQSLHRSIAINDREIHPVSWLIGGLLPGTTYHYQVCAKDDEQNGALCSADESFTTLGTALSVSTTPALYPEFNPGVSDYITRCTTDPVAVSVNAPSNVQVSVDGRPGQTGSFTTDVQLSPGKRFDFTATSAGSSTTFHVRCLPADFPPWTYQRTGRSNLAYTLIGPNLFQVPSHFIAFFDRNGVPVWWYRDDAAVPVDAKLLPDDTIAYASFPGASFGGDPYQIRRLDGSLVRTVGIVGSPTDFHDLQRLPNGNYVVGSYKPRDNVDLTSLGGPASATVTDAVIQEVTPSGSVVWSWSSQDHIALSESSPWATTIVNNPTPLSDGRLAHDIVHINSIEPDGNGYLLSFRHLNATYRILRSNGAIDWKLGGTTTSRSLTVSGDPVSPRFGGQHDIRRLSDGTVALHDNGTTQSRPPRAVRYRIDTSARTATLVESLSDPAIPSSNCCGSSRKLSTGGWLIDWGGTPTTSEYDANGSRISSLSFAPFFSYRAVPIEPGEISAAELRNGMDDQFPRTAAR